MLDIQEISPFGAIAGKLPEMKKWLAASMAYLPVSQHLLGNPEIRIDGDRASGRVMSYNAIAFPVEEGEPTIALLGMWYIDEYVRTPQGWRIARRSQQRSWAQGLPTTS